MFSSHTKRLTLSVLLVSGLGFGLNLGLNLGLDRLDSLPAPRLAEPAPGTTRIYFALTPPQVEKKSAMSQSEPPAQRPAKQLAKPIEQLARIVQQAAEQTTAKHQGPEAQTEPQTAQAIRTDPSLQAAQAARQADYQKQILRLIAARKVYPFGARLKGQEGEVEALLLLDATGAIRDIQLPSPATHPLLNEAALKSIRRASPFPPPPAAAQAAQDGGVFRIRFIMEFHLK